MCMLSGLSPRKLLVKLSSSPAKEERKKSCSPWEDAREQSWAAASKQLPPVGGSGFRAFPMHRGAKSQRGLCKHTLSVAQHCTLVVLITFLSTVPVFTPFHLFSFKSKTVFKMCGSGL